MARWDNYNNVKYKKINIGRRDLFENISYNNAFHVLEYIKYRIDIGKTTKPISQLKMIYYYLEYLHDIKEDILHVTEDTADGFMYYASQRVASASVSIGVYQIACMYDWLLINGMIEKNPFLKTKKLALKARKKQSKVSTNFITDEQIDIIKKRAPLHLKVYAMFSLSSGADINVIQNLRWEHIDFDNRMIQSHEDKSFFSDYVASLLQVLQDSRIKKELDDCGYVFRSHIDANCNKKTRLSKGTIAEWCARLGEIIDIPNLRHLDFRHTAIRRFLSESGSAGMTSVIMNCPRLSNRASRFIVEENNNDLLQEYKDLCEI